MFSKFKCIAHIILAGFHVVLVVMKATAGDPVSTHELISVGASAALLLLEIIYLCISRRKK